MLVVVAGTYHEAVVVIIFHTQTPLYLLHLLLEATRSIVKGLEDTRYGRKVVVLALHAVGVLLVSLSLALLGIGGYQEFVGVGRNRQFVILIEGDGEVASQAKVRRNELRVVIAAVRNLGTDVVDVQPPGK